jgi:BirA family transcriptional regulator, biotin operon repressor / biotin---[acetyl-CoA-carboxylase] ligase
MEYTMPESRIIRLDAVGSTNVYAAEMANQGILPEGSVILAHSQTAGRGYDQNSWESEPGKNLTLSMILYPRFLAAGRQFILTKVVALAVRETVSQLLPLQIVSIKWPNDIYIGDAKVAGILIQHSIMGSGIDNTIVGIGLNVNQVKFHSDAPNPVSMRMISGVDFELRDVLELLCRKIDRNYELLRSRHFGQLDKAYLEHLYRINIFSKFRRGESIFEAKITGVSVYGQLMMESGEGDLLKYGMKEVEFVL